MCFGDKIKAIRLENDLTQERFAERLNVTRQAVSNRENEKNLPDIGMPIRISDVFGVSLDKPIKGDTQMNEKIVRDGSETRRARCNAVTAAVGGGLLFLGTLLIVLKGLSVEYIDAEGFLHENFFLLPLGFLCIFCGLTAFLAVGVRALIALRKKRRNGKAPSGASFSCTLAENGGLIQPVNLV
ncbi:MAG: DUF3955 domain-containing protein [Clostridia bacterium]|nr:DUF3955 domain-containing protein [Clostridia bacterium]